MSVADSLQSFMDSLSKDLDHLGEGAFKEFGRGYGSLGGESYSLNPRLPFEGDMSMPSHISFRDLSFQNLPRAGDYNKAKVAEMIEVDVIKQFERELGAELDGLSFTSKLAPPKTSQANTSDGTYAAQSHVIIDAKAVRSGGECSVSFDGEPDNLPADRSRRTDISMRQWRLEQQGHVTRRSMSSVQGESHSDGAGRRPEADLAFATSALDRLDSIIRKAEESPEDLLVDQAINKSYRSDFNASPLRARTSSEERRRSATPQEPDTTFACSALGRLDSFIRKVEEEDTIIGGRAIMNRATRSNASVSPDRPYQRAPTRNSPSKQRTSGGSQASSPAMYDDRNYKSIDDESMPDSDIYSTSSIRRSPSPTGKQFRDSSMRTHSPERADSHIVRSATSSDGREEYATTRLSPAPASPIVSPLSPRAQQPLEPINEEGYNNESYSFGRPPPLDDLMRGVPFRSPSPAPVVNDAADIAEGRRAAFSAYDERSKQAVGGENGFSSSQSHTSTSARTYQRPASQSSYRPSSREEWRVPSHLSINTSQSKPPTAQNFANPVVPLDEDTPPSASSVDLRPGPFSNSLESPEDLHASMAELLKEHGHASPKGTNYDNPSSPLRHMSIATVPEDNNTRAVVNALRTLQERVGKLECEKTIAKGRIRDLEGELSRTRGMVIFEQGRLRESEARSASRTQDRDSGSQQKSGPRGTSPVTADRVQSPVKVKDEELLERLKTENELRSLKTRSEVLERQLSRTRETADQVENERNEAMKKLEETREELERLRRDMVLKDIELEMEERKERNGEPGAFHEKKRAEMEGPEHMPVDVSQASGDHFRSGPIQILQIEDAVSSTQPAPSPKPKVLSDEDRKDNPSSPSGSIGSLKQANTTRTYPLRATKNVPQDSLRQSVNSNKSTRGGESFLMPEEIEALQKEIEQDRSAREEKRGRSALRIPTADRDKLRKLVVRKVVSEMQKQEVKKTLGVAEGSSMKPTRSFTIAHLTQPMWKKVDGVKVAQRSRTKLGTLRRSTRTVKTQTPPRRKEKGCSPVREHCVGGMAGIRPERVTRDMPFVVGRSTSKSYSVTANLQQVFSLLKAHNPALCSVCSHRKRSPSRERSKSSSSRERPRSQPREKSKARPISPLVDDHASFHGDVLDNAAAVAAIAAGDKTDGGDGLETLERVLKVLEQEFGGLKRQYHHLVQQYESAASETADSIKNNSQNGKNSIGRVPTRLLRAMGNELREVIRSMETKGDQISILRDILRSFGRHLAVHHYARREGNIGGTHGAAYRAKGCEYGQEADATDRKTNQGKAKQPLHEDPTAVFKPKHKASATDLSSDLHERYRFIEHWREQGFGENSRSRSRSPVRLNASLGLLRGTQKVREALTEGLG